VVHEQLIAESNGNFPSFVGDLEGEIAVLTDGLKVRETHNY